MSTNNKPLHIESLAIHGGEAVDDPNGALVAPMYQTSTFVFPNVEIGGERFAGETPGYIYSRLGNPTVRQLEQRIASLEDMEDAAASATGMGAVAATTMAFLESGDHVVASDCIYGCSFALFTHMFKKFGIDVSFVDMSKAENLENAISSKTKMVFLETPANPHLKVIDLAPIGQLCRKYQLKMVVDNTFMTPLMQSPKDFGADLVIHSATKYLNGHGDVVAGIVAGKAEDIELIKLSTLKDMGATMSAHDAWLILRGLKTLPIRMERHCSSALTIVEYLQRVQAVSKIYFPGLNNPKEQALIGPGKQMKAAGAVIAFDMKGGYQAAVNMLNQLSMIKLAVSLGDAETLIQHPASMTHSPLTPEARVQAGIGDGLVRISIGLEHPQDIIADLEQAFNALK